MPHTHPATLVLSVVLLWTACVASALPAPEPSDLATVEGLVLGANDEALAGARIEILPLQPSFAAGHQRLAVRPDPEPLARTTSDASGRFHLECPAGSVARVVAGLEGSLAHQFLPQVLVGETMLPPVALPKSQTETVRLLDAAERPISGVWLFVRSATESRAGGRSASFWRPDFRRGLTDDSGRLTLARTAPEALDLTAFPADGPSKTWRAHSEPILTLPIATAELRTLRILDPRGEPVKDALLRVGELAWPTALSNADGDLRWYGTAGRDDAITILTADGRRTSLRSAPRRGETQELVLPDAFTVSGLILDPNGRPIAGALLWPSFDPAAAVRSNTEGRYEIAVPGDGAAWLQVEAAGFVRRRIPLATQHLTRGRIPSIALETAVAIGGQIVTLDGSALADVRLAALAQGRRPFSATDSADSRDLSQPDGSFDLGGLRPGTAYRLVASLPGFAAVTMDVWAPMANDPNPRVEIVLAADRAAGGRVIDVEEQPVAEAAIRLSVHGVHRRSAPRRGPAIHEDPFRAVTDEQGLFHVAAIPAAEIDVTIAASGHAPMRVRRLRVSAGEGAADLGTFVLIPGVAIRGKVEDSAGDPVAGAAIHAVPPKPVDPSLRLLAGQRHGGRGTHPRADSRDPGARPFAGGPGGR